MEKNETDRKKKMPTQDSRHGRLVPRDMGSIMQKKKNPVACLVTLIYLHLFSQTDLPGRCIRIAAWSLLLCSLVRACRK